MQSIQTQIQQATSPSPQPQQQPQHPQLQSPMKKKRLVSDAALPSTTAGGGGGSSRLSSSTTRLPYLLVVLCVVLTGHAVASLAAARESGFDIRKARREEALEVVWASAWVTAAATGLGVFPFLWRDSFEQRWIAVGNAGAAGMMLAASMGLVAETMTMAMEEGIEVGLFGGSNVVERKNGESDAIVSGSDDEWWRRLVPVVLLCLGGLIGLGFIHESRKRMDQQGDFSVLDLHGADARRVALIMVVMTVHSMSEGVGLGVSYHSQSLGIFVSATLAVHNIPEGLAISMVLIPRGISKLHTLLWCIFSSLPQPIMAIPAFLFVDQFKPMVPLGLGFAAGAMFYVALFDLLTEAQEIIGTQKTMMITSVSSIIMVIGQILIM